MLARVTVWLVLLSSLTSCATRVESDKETILDDWSQAPRVDLSRYRPIQERSGNQSDSMIVAAAISGGGHRAANFGVGVLMALEEIQASETSNVLQEIDYFSTVSGGSFAVGSYLSTLFDYMGTDRAELGSRYQEFRYIDFYDQDDQGDGFCRRSCGTVHESPICVRRNIERGYNAPLINALGSPKVWFTDLDRGDLLEEKIDRNLLASCWRDGERSLVLGDIFVAQGDEDSQHETPPAYYLPYWVMNSTVYENGAIFPFTPDIAERYGIAGFNHNLDRYCIGAQSEPAGCLTVESHFDIPLAVGLKASATFPGAVAATTLRSEIDDRNPYVHLFDGGLSDNLGILTAIDLLEKDPYVVNRKGPVKKVLIVIDAYKSDPEPFSSLEGSPTVLFHVSSKLRGISLDSWRGRHRSVLERMRALDPDVEIIYLSFDTLAATDDSLSVNRKCLEKSKILESARTVKTAFNVSPPEQIDLVCAGYMAVKQETARIRQVFAGHNGR